MELLLLARTISPPVAASSRCAGRACAGETRRALDFFKLPTILVDPILRTKVHMLSDCLVVFIRARMSFAYINLPVAVPHNVPPVQDR